MTGRTAVVTGGAQGVGRAIAARLAGDGCDIALIDPADAAATEALVTEAGRKVRAWQADVSDPEQIADVALEIKDRFGAVDILVDNAGIYPNTMFDDLDVAEWRRVLAVNLDAHFYTAKAFVPGMKDAGWGRVITIVSNSPWLQVTGFTHYVASKMGAIGLVRALATEVASHGITVNAIAPTLMRTPGTTAVPQEFFDLVPETQSIKRVGLPDDVAGVVSFLAGDDAAFMTGQTLAVDGGAARP